MWRGEQGLRAFQAPVDVHASADGQVYMFQRRSNEYTVSSDDKELSVMEMKPQASQDRKYDRNVQLLEREVLEGDNLNKLALQYGCKVRYFKFTDAYILSFFIKQSSKVPPASLFVSTGGRHKAGQQPNAGTRSVCTEVYQDTSSETQPSNRGFLRCK